jgi:hypothetical protein
MTDTAAASAPFDMPPVSAGFDSRGGWVVNRLVADLALTPEQAAGIVGNLGGESGLEAIQEKHPISGRGGFGWEQATGPRRVALEHFCADHDWNITDDEANYGFLLNELNGSEAHALHQLKLTTDLPAAVETFCVYFERPADPEGALPARVEFAKRALAAAKQSAPVPVVAERVPPRPAPMPAPGDDAAVVSPATPAPVLSPTVHPALAAGAAAAPAYGIVLTLVWILGQYGIAVPVELQQAWLGLLMVIGAGLLHSRMAGWFKAEPV